MRIRTTLRNLVLIIGWLLAAAAFAETVRELKWPDLQPPAQTDNPFAKLNKQQRLQLSDIADVRDRLAQGDKTISPIALEDEKAATAQLQKAGIDVDGLLARRKEFAELKRARASAINPALDGQLVRLPGYLLPLEYTGKQVSEFLLVPWTGACVHTPPPPPNQIVHVRSARPVETPGLFMPVWVTGKLSATPAKKSVFVVDGSSDVDVGYAMQASEVEPYTK